MVDSVSVVVGREVAAGFADEPVVPTAGCEREQALRDARDETGDGAGAVAFERELAFGRFEDRFDPLADGAERAEAWPLVFAVGTQQLRAEGGDELLELFTGKAFVGDDEL